MWKYLCFLRYQQQCETEQNVYTCPTMLQWQYSVIRFLNLKIEYVTQIQVISECAPLPELLSLSSHFCVWPMHDDDVEVWVRKMATKAER